MQQNLRVDSGGLQTMATRWGAAAGELNATAVPPMPVPAAPAQGNRIQAVDNRTWKQDPTPAPPPEPATGPSADDIRKVLDKLPVGNSPDVREIRSPEDLQNLWRWAQQNGVEIPNG